jgi:hypothetical protein
VLQRIVRIIDLIIYVFLSIVLLSASNPISGDAVERARAFTRPIEFDYVSWSAEAALLKLQSNFLGLPGYLTHEDRKQAVMQHLFLTERILQAEDQLNRIYADPAIPDKEAASTHLRAHLEIMYQRQKQLVPMAETTLQAQISAMLVEQNLTSGGQPIPPVLYHTSAVPMGLIVSSRERIQQITNISVQPDLSVDQQSELEEQVDAALNVSSLIVPIGGVGVYPTMVMRTTALAWQLDTIAHEWTHNYLTLRPLGFLYDATPELRTMNETAASIVGGEIGTLVMQRYYPELVDASHPPLQLASGKPASPNPDGETPPFDYRAEMHTTRVTVDAMLAEGKIEEAEAYMEARREIFWQNGYTIRKLNQAYFAFYGAYADVPGGAAGEDPVGPAVRALRLQSDSLADFINRISWMTSFEELQAAIQ